MTLAQDRLQVGRLAGVNKAERDAAVTSAHRMVQAVGNVEPLQVAPAWDPVEGPALMHQAIVHQEVEQAVDRHAAANPLQGPDARRACGDQRDSYPGKDHRKEIVQLKHPFARGMVGFMPAPSPAVHNIAMGKGGDALHRNDA